MTKQKPKKLFKVASEFNVTTQSIVDALGKNGFDVANRPNSNINEEMYSVLDRLMIFLKNLKKKNLSQRPIQF